jgi:Tfp pilus assembly protein PilP
MKNKLIGKYLLWANSVYKRLFVACCTLGFYKHYLPIIDIYQLITRYLLIIVMVVSCTQNKPTQEYNNLKDIKLFIQKLETNKTGTSEAFTTKALSHLLTGCTLISNKDIFTLNSKILNPNNYNSYTLVGIIKNKGKYTGLVQFANGSKTVEIGQHTGDGEVVAIDASGVKLQKNIGQLKYTKLLLIGALT